MLFPKSALFYGILIAVLLEPISGRRVSGGGSHSYPKSDRLSGGGHRSGKPSGGGYGYSNKAGAAQQSGGGHRSDKPSGGEYGYSNKAGAAQQSGGGHRSDKPSGGGYGYSNKAEAAQHHTTKVYNHYHYTPPRQISYAPVHGGPPMNYPVYRGTPPTYVYQYNDSGSKYGTLLAGLALLNLGTLDRAASGHKHSSQSHYKPQPGEVCKFAVRKHNGDYEETKIDCQIISSFILQDHQTQQGKQGGTNSSVVTTTVTNTTVVNTTNTMMPELASTPAPVAPALGNVLYAMLPNGTLVPVNATGVSGVPGLPGSLVNVTLNETASASPNGTVLTSSVITTTTTNTTLVNALDVKGKPVDVTPGMKCYVIRNSARSNMRKSVPCGLLRTYAVKSIQRNSAVSHRYHTNSGISLNLYRKLMDLHKFTIVAAIINICVAY